MRSEPTTPTTNARSATDTPNADPADPEVETADRSETDDASSEGKRAAEPKTVYEHANEVIREGTDSVRFLDEDGTVLEDTTAGDAYEALETLDDDPSTVVLDAIVSQQLLDLATDEGVDRIVARSLGQFTKRPTAVRIHAIDEIADEPPEQT